MAIPAKNILGNPNVTEGSFQIAIEQLRESVIGSGKVYDSANTYMAKDTCEYSGVMYYSKIDNNIGNTPSIGANWGDYADLINGVVHKTGDETIAGVKTFSGNVGVGVAPVAGAGSLQLSNISSLGFLGPYGYVWANTKYTDTYRYITSAPATSFGHSNGSYIWRTAPSGTADNPITWTTAMTLDASGNLLLTSGTGAIGYGTGAGGTVTQLTSKATLVYLNKPSGTITMNSGALAAGESVVFGFYNSMLSVFSLIKFQIIGGYAAYDTYKIESDMINEQVVRVKLTNVSAGSLSESLILSFNIIKGANS